MTLVEILIALPIVCLVALIVGTLTIFGARSFLAMTNYLEMENDSRIALDTLSRDIRQAQTLLEFTSHRLLFQDYDDARLEFAYSPQNRTLTRTKGDQTSILLRGCDYLEFSVFQRTPIAETYDHYPSTSGATGKLVRIRWLCSRSLPGGAGNTECVQNAKVVIRKKRSE